MSAAGAGPCREVETLPPDGLLQPGLEPARPLAAMTQMGTIVSPAGSQWPLY